MVCRTLYSPAGSNVLPIRMGFSNFSWRVSATPILFCPAWSSRLAPSTHNATRAINLKIRISPPFRRRWFQVRTSARGLPCAYSQAGVTGELRSQHSAPSTQKNAKRMGSKMTTESSEPKALMAQGAESQASKGDGWHGFDVGSGGLASDDRLVRHRFIRVSGEGRLRTSRFGGTNLHVETGPSVVDLSVNVEFQAHIFVGDAAARGSPLAPVGAAHYELIGTDFTHDRGC